MKLIFMLIMLMMNGLVMAGSAHYVTQLSQIEGNHRLNGFLKQSKGRIVNNYEGCSNITITKKSGKFILCRDIQCTDISWENKKKGRGEFTESKIKELPINRYKLTKFKQGRLKDNGRVYQIEELITLIIKGDNLIALNVDETKYELISENFTLKRTYSSRHAYCRL